MKLLDKLLKRKNPGAKNTVFVDAGRRGGIRSGEVRRARAERRRSLEASVTEVAERVKVLLRTPMEPTPAEEMTEEGGALEGSVLSSLEPALNEFEVSDIRCLHPSQQHVEKAMEELEDVKYVFEIPYTLSIFENLAKRSVGKAKTPETIEKGVEALRKESVQIEEEVKRILRTASQ